MNTSFTSKERVKSSDSLVIKYELKQTGNIGERQNFWQANCQWASSTILKNHIIGTILENKRWASKIKNTCTDVFSFDY